MKKMIDLLIHLDDHKHDKLGRLFVDTLDDKEMRRELRDYLGAKVTVKQMALNGHRLRVKVELPDFQTESDNLAVVGAGRGDIELVAALGQPLVNHLRPLPVLPRGLDGTSERVLINGVRHRSGPPAASSVRNS